MPREACKYFRSGVCFRGANCWYVHEERRPAGAASAPASAPLHRSPSSSSSTRDSDARSRPRPLPPSFASSHHNSSSRSSHSVRAQSSHRSSDARASPRSSAAPRTFHHNHNHNYNRSASDGSSRGRAPAPPSSYRSSSSSTTRAPLPPPSLPFETPQRSVGEDTAMQSAVHVTSVATPNTTSNDGHADANAGAGDGDEHEETSGSWGESLLEAVAKCDGASGKKLYCTSSWLRLVVSLPAMYRTPVEEGVEKRGPLTDERIVG